MSFGNPSNSYYGYDYWWSSNEYVDIDTYYADQYNNYLQWVFFSFNAFASVETIAINFSCDAYVYTYNYTTYTTIYTTSTIQKSIIVIGKS